MVFMPDICVNGSQYSNNCNQNMTVQEKVCHYIGTSIPSQHTKHSSTSVYAYEAKWTKRAIIRGINVIQRLKHGTSVSSKVIPDFQPP